MSFAVLGISGSIRRPSRTTALVRSILAAVNRRLDGDTDLIELVDAAPILFGSLTRADTSAAAEAIIEAVEAVDVLVVATPVYRASYTGALKHLFDLVHHDALTGKPVVLAATGGSTLHGLVTEHELRPLMGFFGALTLPTAIYATEADFDGHALVSPTVSARIGRAVDELSRLVAGSFPAPPRVDRPLVAARS